MRRAYGAGEQKGAPQPHDALAGMNLAEARIAGGEHDKLGPIEIEAGHVLGCQ